MATTHQTSQRNAATEYAATVDVALDMLLALDAALTPPLVKERLNKLHTAIEHLAGGQHSARTLDEALQAVDGLLEFMPDNGDLLALRRQLVRGTLMILVKSGFASWSGGKPRGAIPRVKLDLDRPLSDYVIENRR